MNGRMSALDLCSAGASPNAKLAWDDPEWAESYWDDVNGGYLDTELTREARKLEIEWCRKENVWTKVPRSLPAAEGAKILSCSLSG